MCKYTCKFILFRGAFENELTAHAQRIETEHHCVIETTAVESRKGKKLSGQKQAHFSATFYHNIP